MGRVLATGINVPHLTVFDDIYAQRMAGIDVGQCMPNFVDHVNESALYWLASMYNVLGDKGWNSATTVSERRELVKSAVELARYKGTPFAIKQALRTMGYTSIVITEGVAGPNNQYDGSWQYDGSVQYGLLNIGNGWATFSVDASGPFPDSPTVQERAIKLILENKNTRSLLVSFTHIEI